ncbi:retroviral-like aspartic protease family protein [Caulobacter mirabilis]|uniref:Peptidase A2A n=1 Tax=Caulobacter mirabilis TaxID=69666 RepID=A0A2D2AYA5_9CAUL|nr:retroviral-like aspartic protease family protein [Caulobacter mirabilis]ATQ43009.1 peptidase A2A [Caulobacter mirabilis]
MDWNRRSIVAALGALAPSAVAWAEPAPETGVNLKTGRDDQERMTIPVRIGNVEGYDFVVDTGADRSVLASDVAAALGLPAGRKVLIHGITGQEVTATVRCPALKVGEVTLPPQELPVIDRPRLGADGLLGMDVLQNRRLTLDFRQRRLDIRAASGASPARLDPRWVIVPTDGVHGHLTIISARVGTIAATAFVDSGASMTIANPALAQAMRSRRRWQSSAPQVTLAGVTDHAVTGEGRIIPQLRLGTMSFSHVPVVVCDLHLFRQWRLDDRPAILLGVDVLRMFAKVELDYGRRRLLFRAGQAPPPLMA